GVQVQERVADSTEPGSSEMDSSEMDSSEMDSSEPDEKAAAAVTLFSLDRYQATQLAFDGITLSAGQQLIDGIWLDGRYNDGRLAG
ncbi:hypothetical protein Q4595_28275, partial [Wenyingzhuangia sp. 1_MG-2023]|nr:hypothetical protein [Wenyingzhuangia sp. 1_MG-2023]